MQVPALIGVTRIRVIETSASQEFYIPTDVLRSMPTKSFFQAAVSEDADVIEIEDCDIDTFVAFLMWCLASDGLFYDDLYTNPVDGIDWKSLMPLIKLHILAGIYGVQKMSEAALHRFTDLVSPAGTAVRDSDTFPAGTKFNPNLHEITFIYQNTEVSSPLRPVVVKAFCEANGHLENSLLAADKMQVFLIDVINYMRHQNTQAEEVNKCTSIANNEFAQTLDASYNKGKGLDLDFEYDSDATMPEDLYA